MKGVELALSATAAMMRNIKRIINSHSLSYEECHKAKYRPSLNQAQLNVRIEVSNGIHSLVLQSVNGLPFRWAKISGYFTEVSYFDCVG